MTSNVVYEYNAQTFEYKLLSRNNAYYKLNNIALISLMTISTYRITF